MSAASAKDASCAALAEPMAASSPSAEAGWGAEGVGAGESAARRRGGAGGGREEGGGVLPPRCPPSPPPALLRAAAAEAAAAAAAPAPENDPSLEIPPPREEFPEDEKCTARRAAVASACSSAPLAAPFAAGEPPSRAAANSERRQAMSASPCGTKCSAVAAVSRAWTTQSCVEGGASVTRAAELSLPALPAFSATGIIVAAATNLATIVPSPRLLLEPEELQEAEDSPWR